MKTLRRLAATLFPLLWLLGTGPKAFGQFAHSELAKLLASDGAQGFGTSVSLSGDVAVVGASFDHIGFGSLTGSAYVFRWNGAAWVQEQKLLASDGAQNDYFGTSVSLSGDVAVVGAPGKHSLKGSAYVFRWNGSAWVQEQQLLASDGVGGDRFGTSVTVSGDVAIVGAPTAFNPGTLSGSAYVFRWNGATWVQEQKLFQSDGEYSFGGAVSVSGDVAVVGAPNFASSGGVGSAYVFRWNGSAWVQEQKLLASDGAGGDRFGTSVTVSGDVAVVGAPDKDFASSGDVGSAYVFRWNGSAWVQEQKLLASDGAASDSFGTSVSLSGDVAVVGAPGKNSFKGSAYVFRWNGSAWVQEQKLLASDGATSRLGISVSLSGDVALVGNGGSAYVFPSFDPCQCSSFGDLCQLPADCNGNGFPDSCDLEFGFASNCDCDGIPDSCEVTAASDCNDNQVLDTCEARSIAALAKRITGSIGPGIGAEGVSVNLTSSFDPLTGVVAACGLAPTSSTTWNFGDGSNQVVGGSPALHTYADNGTYIVRAQTVTPKNGEASLESSITVGNIPPSVSAGPDQNLLQEVGGPLPVNLVGVVTDPGADEHWYLWDFGDGQDTRSSCNTGVCAVVHSYAQGGRYEATIFVIDDDGDVGSDTVKIHVNNPPVSVPGAFQQVPPGVTVTLDGSQSWDPNEDRIASYTWQQLTGPQEMPVILNNAGKVQAQFTAPEPEFQSQVLQLLFQLTVVDEFGATHLAPTLVEVRNGASPPPNPRLVVDAGPDHTIAPGGSVTLAGDAIGGRTVPFYTYQWWMVVGANGANSPALNLNGTTIRQPLASPPLTTTYRLVVTEVITGQQASDTMTVFVPAPGEQDGDGVTDAIDNCPSIANGVRQDSQADTDSDGHGNACDLCPNDSVNDPDQDDRCTAMDNCPFVHNSNQLDLDGDGFGNSCDRCVAFNDRLDRDGDSHPDACDNCPDVGNAFQQDSDQDGVGDACDRCSNADDRLDPDGDGIATSCDDCPRHFDPLQVDADGDSNGDACDLCSGHDDYADNDGDEVPDGCDNCPCVWNQFQDDRDGDGVGNACDLNLCAANAVDQDADGVTMSCDNCPYVPNIGQMDSDQDGVGNACDQCQGYDDQFDCNLNGVPDGCDLLDQTSEDRNNDDVPDDCWADFADVDRDSDVDQDDTEMFVACLQMGNPASLEYCRRADFDGNRRIDLADFFGFQRAFGRQCEADWECNDLLYCTGQERCDIVLGCVNGVSPCAGGPTCVENLDACTTSVFDLTLNIDTLMGTPSVDVFNAPVAFYNGVLLPTLGIGDTANGLGGADSLNATLVGNAGTILASISNVETFNVSDLSMAGTWTINGATISGLREINAINSLNTNPLVFTNLSSVVDLGLTNTNSGITVGFTNTATVGATDAINLALYNVQGGTVIINAAATNGVETINVSSNGSANTLTTITQNTGTTLATLSLSGSQDLTIANALQSSIRTVNAGSATGGVNVNVSNNTGNVTLTGGAGNDTFTVGANYTSNDTVNGGAGTGDTLAITSAAANVAFNQANVTNVEGLAITNSLVNAINLSRFGSVTTFNLENGVNVVSTLTVVSGMTINLNDGTDSTANLTVDIVGLGTSDTVNVNVNDHDTSSAYIFTNLETLSLASNSNVNGANADNTNTNTIGGALMVMPTSGTGAINLIGPANLTIIGPVSAGTLNASTFVGNLVMSQPSNSSLTITGGWGNDTLFGSVGNDTISSGAGSNVIEGRAGVDTITLAGLVDVIRVASVAPNGGHRKLVTGFTAGPGGDVINIDANDLLTLSGTNNFTTSASIQTHSVVGNLTVAVSAEIVRVTSGTLMDFTSANSLNGTNLLTVVGGNITLSADQNQNLFLVGDITGKVGVYLSDESNDAGAVLAAGDITLIAILSAVPISNLVFSNFSNIN